MESMMISESRSESFLGSCRRNLKAGNGGFKSCDCGVDLSVGGIGTKLFNGLGLIKRPRKPQRS